MPPRSLCAASEEEKSPLRPSSAYGQYAWRGSSFRGKSLVQPVRFACFLACRPSLGKQPCPLHPQTARARSPLRQREVGHPSSWAMVWIVGAPICAGVFVFLYARSLSRFRSAVPLEPPYVRRWLEGHPLRRPLQVRAWAGTDVPLTYGVFAPVILLPAEGGLRAA